MPDLTAKRTLVKSPPELWEELSEVEGLMKHLSAFGEIKITKLEPEHTVAWEGEHGSGTVSIEPSGWGTKVTFHAELPEAAENEPESVTAEPEPVTAEPEPVTAEPEPVTAEPESVTAEPEVAEPEPVAAEPEPVEPEPEAVAIEPEPAAIIETPEPPRRRRGFFGWLFRTRTAVVDAEPEQLAEKPEPVAIDPEPKPVAIDAEPKPVAIDAEPAQVTIETDAVVPEPEPDPEPEPEPESESESESESNVDPAPHQAADEGLDPDRARVILDEALDALGAAHHRPFSRG